MRIIKFAGPTQHVSPSSTGVYEVEEIASATTDSMCQQQAQAGQSPDLLISNMLSSSDYVARAGSDLCWLVLIAKHVGPDNRLVAGSTVLAREAGRPRRAAYRALKRLESKGLIRLEGRKRTLSTVSQLESTNDQNGTLPSRIDTKNGTLVSHISKNGTLASPLDQENGTLASPLVYEGSDCTVLNNNPKGLYVSAHTYAREGQPEETATKPERDLGAEVRSLADEWCNAFNVLTVPAGFPLVAMALVKGHEQIDISTGFSSLVRRAGEGVYKRKVPTPENFARCVETAKASRTAQPQRKSYGPVTGHTPTSKRPEHRPLKKDHFVQTEEDRKRSLAIIDAALARKAS